MSKGITLKLNVDSDPQMILDFYKNDAGLLVIEMYEKDPEGSNGGQIVVDPDELFNGLKSLLGK